MEEHYKKIHLYYNEFEKHLLKNGLLLSKDTGVGYWGVTHIPAAFQLFKKIDLQAKKFLDLGSGDGRIAFLASLFAEKVDAIEFDQWLHESAVHIQSELDIPHSSRIQFINADFKQHSISGYDVVYMSPDKPFYRDGLNQKLQKELTGKLIVHGWEFFPEGLKFECEEVVDGEKFRVYVRG
ncbi:hypothetical protein HZA96_07315 [Candidatus Woesearchaeota archaeon]|nr:hypothetical protein [Candidatus Woesearchaeota archaeon]